MGDVFKGGSTQNRWLLMGDFSKGGVHKTDGFWNVFLLLLKVKRSGCLFRQTRFWKNNYNKESKEHEIWIELTCVSTENFFRLILIGLDLKLYKMVLFDEFTWIFSIFYVYLTFQYYDYHNTNETLNVAVSVNHFHCVEIFVFKLGPSLNGFFFLFLYSSCSTDKILAPPGAPTVAVQTSRGGRPRLRGDMSSAGRRERRQSPLDPGPESSGNQWRPRKRVSFSVRNGPWGLFVQTGRRADLRKWYSCRHSTVQYRAWSCPSIM